MGSDEEQDWGDSLPREPLLPPEDRVWRHPSELGALGATAADAPIAIGLAARRQWGVAATSALAAAVLVTGLWAAFGPIQLQTVHITERVPVAPLDSTPPRLVDASDWATELAAATWPSIVLLDDRASGVVLRDDGVVVTSAAVSDGAETLTVRTAQGRTVDAALVGADPITDVAVYRIAEDAERLTPALVQTTSSSRADPVAIVAALAGDALVDQAQIAATGQMTIVAGEHVHGVAELDRVVDAPGAAVVDAVGAVVGLMTVANDEASYFIPIGEVRDVARQLVEQGFVEHDPWLGAIVTGIGPDVTRSYGFTGAVRIDEVVSSGPADDASLREGDVVFEVNDRSVGGESGFAAAVNRSEPGEGIVVSVLRDAEVQRRAITLGARSGG